MKIRLARRDDARAIAALHAASWRSAYRGILSDAYLDGDIATERAAVWQERFDNPQSSQHIAIAEDRFELVGFACAYGREDDPWGTLLDNLHVLPESRGHGVGRELMAHVASWHSKVFPSQGMFLWVFEQNHRARRFYDKLGGMVVEQRIWKAPDETLVTELRYAWKSLERIQAAC